MFPQIGRLREELQEESRERANSDEARELLVQEIADARKRYRNASEKLSKAEHDALQAARKLSDEQQESKKLNEKVKEGRAERDMLVSQLMKESEQLKCAVLQVDRLRNELGDRDKDVGERSKCVEDLETRVFELENSLQQAEKGYTALHGKMEEEHENVQVCVRVTSVRCVLGAFGFDSPRS